MGKIDAFLNKQTDWNWGWYPFLFLRPAKSVEFSNGRIFVMAILYGFLGGTLIYLWRNFQAQTEFEISGHLGAVLFTQVLFFIGYKFTYASAWNRRAKFLATGNADHSSST